MKSLLVNVLVLIVASSPAWLYWSWQAYRRAYPAPMDRALGEIEGDVVELPTIDEMLGDEKARERARRHIGSVGFDGDGFKEEFHPLRRHPITHSVIFVTRLDGGVQTLERRPWEIGDEHLDRAKLLAAMLGVEFREL
jgi:hypothetical protein